MPGADRLSLLKTGALAVALGVAAWLLAPVLLPSNVPQDYPKLPPLGSLNPSLRDALKSADREARRRPGSAEAMGRLGMAYHANLFPEQAARAYRIAARLAPGDWQWVYCQAFLEEENGNQQEQLRLLEQTLRLKPDHAISLLKLADASFKMDRLDEAARYYEKVAHVPEGSASVQAAFGLARVAARRREWSRVVEYCVPLAQANPRLRPLYGLLQQAYEALGQAGNAADAQRRAALADLTAVPPPDDPLDEQLTDLSYSPTRLLKYAGRLSRSRQPDRAIQVARRAASADPKDPDARSFLARTLLIFFGDKPDAVDEALTQMGEYVRLRPDDLTPLWTFTNDFVAAPRPGAALDRLYALLRPHANSADGRRSLGLVADAKGDAAEAVSLYEAALKDNPNDPVAHNKLGQVLDRAGRYEEAATHFRRSIDLSPQDVILRRNFAIALIQQGKYSQGIKEFSEALRGNPYDVPALIGMGFALLNLDRTGEAIPIFRDVVRYQPNSAEGRYGLGFALSAQGKRGDAVRELKEALRLRPEFPEAQDLLGKLER
ncbi:MAG: tetratricopeptide repeat protein [Bryobacteraceae bacterium]